MYSPTEKILHPIKIRVSLKEFERVTGGELDPTDDLCFPFETESELKLLLLEKL